MQGTDPLLDLILEVNPLKTIFLATICLDLAGFLTHGLYSRA
jgi:hypothetical protein